MSRRDRVFPCSLDSNREYIQALQPNSKTVPPAIIIEVHLEGGGEAEILRGTNNNGTLLKVRAMIRERNLSLEQIVEPMML